VQRHGPFGSFRFAGTRPLDGGSEGSVLELRGPDGRGIDIVLQNAARAGRSTVSVDVHLAGEVDLEMARPIVAEVLRTQQE
jgi:hypothetical protein